MSDSAASRPWLSALARLAGVVEDGVDLVRYGVRSSLGGERTLRVATYHTYGTPRQLRVAGRVLRDAPLSASVADAGAWSNLVATYRRFETDEVPGARVRVSVAGVVRDASADREGSFDVVIDLENPTEPGDHPAEVELLEP